MRNPFGRRAPRPETVHINLSEVEAIEASAVWTDSYGRELVAQGRLAEARAVYADDAEACRNVVAAAEAAGASPTPEVADAVSSRISNALSHLGLVEAQMRHTEPALDHTAQAVEIGRRLARENPEIRDRLATGLMAFVAVRLDARAQLPQAAEAAAEAIGILGPLAKREPGVFGSQLGQMTLFGDQIRNLLATGSSA
jgi:hypothetical protein